MPQGPSRALSPLSVSFPPRAWFCPPAPPPSRTCGWFKPASPRPLPVVSRRCLLGVCLPPPRSVNGLFPSPGRCLTLPALPSSRSPLSPGPGRHRRLSAAFAAHSMPFSASGLLHAPPARGRMVYPLLPPSDGLSSLTQPRLQPRRPRPFTYVTPSSRSRLVNSQRLARSGQWRRSPRPDPRWRRRGLRAGGGEAACGGPSPSSALRRCAAGPAGRWARSLAGWPAGPAPPFPSAMAAESGRQFWKRSAKLPGR